MYWLTLSCSTKSSGFTIRLFIVCGWLISSSYLCCAHELVAQNETSRSSFSIIFATLSGSHFCTHQIPNVMAHSLLMTGWKHIVHLTLGITRYLVFFFVNVRCHNKYLNVWIIWKHFIYLLNIFVWNCRGGGGGLLCKFHFAQSTGHFLYWTLRSQFAKFLKADLFFKKLVHYKIQWYLG